jgi:hypothetical protein
MQKEESLKKVISSVQVANANIIVPLTQRNQPQFRLTILPRAKLLRLKEISRFSAKTTQMTMLCGTAATTGPCYARIAPTKNTQIT